MIKWFKSMFNEDEEYPSQKQVNEIENQEIADKEDKKETGRIIERDRRFRFPLVPDETAATVQDSLLPRKEILTKPTMFTNPYAEKEVAKDEVVEETKPIEVPVFKRREEPVPTRVENQEGTREVEEVTIKKPFRPTEIPSPVYGFKRPNVSEISPSTPQAQIQQNEIDEILRKNRSAFIKEEQPLQKQVKEVVEFELPTELSFFDELGIKSSEIETIEQGKSDIEVNEEGIEEETTLHTPVEIEKEEKGNEQSSSDNGKPYNVEIENNIQIHLHQQGTENQDVIHVEKVQEFNTQTNSVQESYVQSNNECDSEKSDVEEVELLEEQEIEHSQIEEEVSDVQTSYEEIEPEKEKKRHIPFNVMMLRKDKEALARKNHITVSEEVVNKDFVESIQTKTEVIVHENEKEEKITKEIVEEEDTSKPEVSESELFTYDFPSVQLLEIAHHAKEGDDEWVKGQWELLDQTLFNFNVGAKVMNVTQGPAVTRFEVQPEPGVKVNKITNLTDDIKLNLAAKDIRIEAPIPGKNAVGIEVPNKKSNPVFLREILETPTFKDSSSPLTIALGLDISGNPVVADIRKMPHGLIAGATGSGKSVCINSLLVSILYKALPQQVKLLLIDPKMVELAPYNHIPHLVSPVITDAKAATAALKWAVEEMDRRYELFAHAGARDLVRYNELAERHKGETLPYLVIIIDELADLMMVAPGDVEEAICRIAQKARACGIHLIVATQRPSVDVITGLIKANIPTRTAFTVSSQVDSRTIIDTSGAEKLLGRGDMLFLNNGESKPIRVQGVYVSDDEIERVVSHVKEQMAPNYLFRQDELLTKVAQADAEDELYLEACEYVVEQEGASASMLQRRFRIGYNRAARLIELMESRGIISEAKGSKPREVLISHDDLVDMLES